jgi:hypothetical protein
VQRNGGQADVHGAVTCLRVEGNHAIIAGEGTRGEGEFFRVDIEDAGRGVQGQDLVVVTFPDEADCDDDVAVDDEFASPAAT